MSYPTVKTRLKEINIALGIEETTPDDLPNLDVLESLEKGKIDVKQALKQIEEERL